VSEQIGDAGEPGGAPLRPLGIGEVLDAAFGLYRRTATSLWRIVLIVIAPVAAVEQVAIAASLPRGSFVRDGTLYTPTGTVGGLAVVVQLVLGLLSVLVLNGALAICLVDAYIGNPIDWRESLRAAAERLGPLVWLALAYGIAVTVAFVLFVVPGVYLVVVWSVSIPALMFERVGAVGALGRSLQLTRGRWWATFAVLLCAAALLGAALLAVGAILGAVQSALAVSDTAAWAAIGALGTIVTDLIVYPFIAAVTAVLYIDLRVRREGLSLERLAGELGRPGRWG